MFVLDSFCLNFVRSVGKDTLVSYGEKNIFILDRLNKPKVPQETLN